MVVKGDMLLKIKTKVLNREYVNFWKVWNPFQPIGIHIGLKDMKPRKYIKTELSLREYIKEKIYLIKYEIGIV